VFFTPEVRPALAGLPHSEETPYYEHSGDFSCSRRATDSRPVMPVDVRCYPSVVIR
jgi:hypothetical protein